jgi:hypothetical protein
MSKQEQRIAIEIRGLLKVIKYFGITFLAGWLSSYVATRFFNADFLILNYHLQHLWLLAPEGSILFGGLYIWNWSRVSEKKKQQKQAKEQIKSLLQQAAGGEKKK